jgi:hypothetical protein
MKHYSDNTSIWYDKINMTDLYPHLKTGDIILFTSAVHSPVNSMLSQTYFSHVGMIIKYCDSIYITESTAGGELMPYNGEILRMNNGVDIIPILPRLKNYTGLYYIMRLSEKLKYESESELIRKAEDLFFGRFPYPKLKQIFMGMLGIKSKSHHCFQHVAYLMSDYIDNQVYKEGYIDVCHYICGISGKKLSSGLYYSEPLQIMYDL